jgi:hypothetical protein
LEVIEQIGGPVAYPSANSGSIDASLVSLPPGTNDIR